MQLTISEFRELIAELKEELQAETFEAANEITELREQVEYDKTVFLNYEQDFKLVKDTEKALRELVKEKENEIEAINKTADSMRETIKIFQNENCSLKTRNTELTEAVEVLKAELAKTAKTASESAEKVSVIVDTEQTEQNTPC